MLRMNKHGFTLVEILIVVVILGILAAIVIPQFSNASQEASINRVRADLQTMRSQIELYKIQHLGTRPTLLGFATQMTAADRHHRCRGNRFWSLSSADSHQRVHQSADHR